MSTRSRLPRLLLAREWGWPGSDIEGLLMRSSNYDVLSVQREQHDWASHSLADIDVVLTFGPHYGTMTQMLEAVERAKRVNRSLRMIWWLSENPPQSILATSVRVLGKVRLLGDALIKRLRPDQHFGTRIVSAGHRYRISELLHRTSKGDLVDVFGVTAAFRVPLLRQIGIEAVFAPYGGCAGGALGEFRGQHRDIDVLWLGRIDNHRRAVFLNEANVTLARHGVSTRIVTSGLDGEARTAMLNRTRLLLNILRAPTDWTGIRLILGAVNGALNLTEPLLDSAPFVAGEHIAVAEPSQLARRALELLDAPQEIERMASGTRLLVESDYSLEKGLSRLLVQAGFEALKFT